MSPAKGGGKLMEQIVGKVVTSSSVTPSARRHQPGIPTWVTA